MSSMLFDTNSLIASAPHDSPFVIDLECRENLSDLWGYDSPQAPEGGSDHSLVQGTVFMSEETPMNGGEVVKGKRPRDAKHVAQLARRRDLYQQRKAKRAKLSETQLQEPVIASSGFTPRNVEELDDDSDSESGTGESPLRRNLLEDAFFVEEIDAQFPDDKGDLALKDGAAPPLRRSLLEDAFFVEHIDAHFPDEDSEEGDLELKDVCNQQAALPQVVGADLESAVSNVAFDILALIDDRGMDEFMQLICLHASRDPRYPTN